MLFTDTAELLPVEPYDVLIGEGERVSGPTGVGLEKLGREPPAEDELAAGGEYE